VKHLEGKGERIYVKNEKKGYETTIMPPSKIVLLGDILDLWDPENSDRSYNIKRGAEPFSLIHETECDKVYVVGNHDQDLYELADVLEKDKTALNLGDHKLEVYRKHYPLNVINGIRIGEIKYAFLHGHQFDKIQITEYVNKKLRIRFDPLDVVQDISNISIVKSVFKEKRPTVVYIILLGISFLLWGYLQTQPGFISTGRTPQFMDIVFSYLWNIPFALLISYVILTPLVKVITKLQGYIWNKFLKAKARDKTVKEVIEEGYYKESSDKMNVDVVIFGHTHIAGSFYLESKNRLFVNTGGWVKETDGRKLNTFAYIDNNGIEVLSWTGKKEDDRYVFEHICTHSADSLKPINTK
jgi:UDP-2,3-diacylglucosamine pyrophosphatase LpxH